MVLGAHRMPRLRRARHLTGAKSSGPCPWPTRLAPGLRTHAAQEPRPEPKAAAGMGPGSHRRTAQGSAPGAAASRSCNAWARCSGTGRTAVPSAGPGCPAGRPDRTGSGAHRHALPSARWRATGGRLSGAAARPRHREVRFHGPRQALHPGHVVLGARLSDGHSRNRAVSAIRPLWTPPGSGCDRKAGMDGPGRGQARTVLAATAQAMRLIGPAAQPSPLIAVQVIESGSIRWPKASCTPRPRASCRPTRIGPKCATITISASG